MTSTCTTSSAAVSGPIPLRALCLTDRQLVVLSAAVQRADHALAPPEALKGAALLAFAKGLVRVGLAIAQPSRSGQPVWTTDGEGKGLTFIATEAAFAALGLEASGVESNQEVQLERQSEEVQEASAATEISGSDAFPAASLSNRDQNRPQLSSPHRRDLGSTKQARLIAMLSSDDGCTMTEAAAELGWLPHTTRAAVTGLRRKGYVIERIPKADDAPSRYRIIQALGSACPVEGA